MLWHGPQRLDRQCIVLKFSTGMRNSTAGAAGGGGQEQQISGKANKNGTSRRAQMPVDFGGCFAYKDDAAHPGKLSEGEQHGQENLEEVKEDPSNEAADGAWVQEVGPSSMTRARSATARAGARALF